MKRKVLIVGIDSSIGSALAHVLKLNSSIDVYGTSRRNELKGGIYHCNLTDKDTVYSHDILPVADFVVICAGLTNIDECENNPELCNLVNYSNTSKLMKFYSNSHQIFLSTNRVFSGKKPAEKAYSGLSAKTAYGKSKAKCELYLRKNIKKYTIIRMTKVLSQHNDLFEKLLDSCINEKKADVFDNLSLSPISLSYAVSVLKQVIDQNIEGVIQLSGVDDFSYAETLEKLCDNLLLKKDFIRPIQGNINEELLGRFTSLDTSNNPEGLRSPCTFEQGFEDLIKQYKQQLI